MIALKKSFLFDLLLFIIVSFFANGLYYMFFYASSSWIEDSIISTIGISILYVWFKLVHTKIWLPTIFAILLGIVEFLLL